jgi:hypothetical protein
VPPLAAPLPEVTARGGASAPYRAGPWPYRSTRPDLTRLDRQRARAEATSSKGLKSIIPSIDAEAGLGNRNAVEQGSLETPCHQLTSCIGRRPVGALPGREPMSSTQRLRGNGTKGRQRGIGADRGFDRHLAVGNCKMPAGASPTPTWSRMGNPMDNCSARHE